MLERFRAYLARPTFFVAAGIAIGALLAPAFGGGGAQAITTYTRAVSCPGLAWQPLISTQETTTIGSYRNGDGFFVCGVDLPHKAVVTRVRFTLLDSDQGDITNCALVRVPLTIDNANSLQVLASVGTTTDVNIQRPSDTTISFATVDNMTYSYFLQCEIEIGSNYYDQGIYGADITYKITATNG